MIKESYSQPAACWSLTLPVSALLSPSLDSWYPEPLRESHESCCSQIPTDYERICSPVRWSWKGHWGFFLIARHQKMQPSIYCPLASVRRCCSACSILRDFYEAIPTTSICLPYELALRALIPCFRRAMPFFGIRLIGFFTSLLPSLKFPAVWRPNLSIISILLSLL